MTKVVLITDTHFGVRSNSDKFLDNMELFYHNIFFPFLDNNDWDVIVHLGDVFHDRRKIDTYTLKRTREMFTQPLFNRLVASNKHMYFICGNHDLYFKDRMEPNNLQEFLEYQDFNTSRSQQSSDPFSKITTQPYLNNDDNISFKPFKIITKPTESEFGLLIPWINKDNKSAIMSSVEKSHSKYLYAHLELQGFNFSKSQIATHGDDPKGFSKFIKVLTGHYHYRHNKGNVYYLGSPSEQTRVDTGTHRGFHLLDTETDQLQFFENNYNIFEDVNISKVSSVVGDHPKFFRLYYDHDKITKTQLNNAIQELTNKNAYDVEAISTSSNITVEQSEQTLENIEDTPTFIKNFVDNPDVSSILLKLYDRAMQLQ